MVQTLGLQTQLVLFKRWTIWLGGIDGPSFATGESTSLVPSSPKGRLGCKGMGNSPVSRLTLNGVRGSKKDSRSIEGELSISERGRKKGEDVDESCYRVCCYFY